ncbi:HERV-H LTR-associating protein 1 [Lepisosteus oculatus]|uniref:HERV-H LTR-associating protein 1 n=1 Tax=Lepisosteus oculatus TaxID=7918 RepID=UPI0037212850
MTWLQEQRKRWCYCVIMRAAMLLLLVFCNHVVGKDSGKNLERRELLVSKEFSTNYFDPTSIDLTDFVNILLNSSKTGSNYLFSMLSVTSHSSLALHKITILVYNISDFRNIEPSTFPMRYCYCFTNRTNDLTDFTAVLLDIMENSTSYLQELFKSSSILSVSQSNNSDCIFICVMAGKTDRDLSLLWKTESVKPLFSHTVIGNVDKGNDSFHTPSPLLLKDWDQTEKGSSGISTLKPSEMQYTTSSQSTITEPRSSVIPSFVSNGMITKVFPRDKPGCPWERPKVVNVVTEAMVTTGLPVTVIPKLNTCVMEMCRFFQRCLCRVYSKRLELRYCAEYYSWYVKHNSEMCRKVKRIAFSKTLKQKCLAKMCTTK